MGFRTSVIIAESKLPLREKLEWHITGNFYPPIDLVYLPMIVKACLDAHVGNWGNKHLLPDGKFYSVKDMVEQLHLAPFIERIEGIPDEH